MNSYAHPRVIIITAINENKQFGVSLYHTACSCTRRGRMSSYGWDKLHFLVFIHLSFYLHFIEFHFYGWDRKGKERCFGMKKNEIKSSSKHKLMNWENCFCCFFPRLFSHFPPSDLRLSSNLFSFFSAIFHTINKMMRTGWGEKCY
jgi:hypothetical protein